MKRIAWLFLALAWTSSLLAAWALGNRVRVELYLPVEKAQAEFVVRETPLIHKTDWRPPR
jgi:hypothetical protein